MKGIISSRAETTSFADQTKAEPALQSVVIAATFTADMLQQPIDFWLKTLEIPGATALAPYAQVMQELLNQESATSRNGRGFNVLLIRLEDWLRDVREENAAASAEQLRRACNDFVAAVGAHRARAGAEVLVVLCPSSASLPAVYRKEIERRECEIVERTVALDGVHCWRHEDVMRLYPVAGHEDPVAARLGHIPYTNEYFVAVATLLARRMAALLKPRCKVIAVDCDNTLWKGVAGEDGPAGVELTFAHQELQKMLVRQHDAGVLICLCSKNNVSDVEAIFRAHPEMPLSEEHIICSRVNWEAKSSNLLSLAEELGLALDSFVLVDDSPLECEEVRTHCPSVLALQFPQSMHEAQHFLDHVWAFDRVGVTGDARKRTALYKQNQSRLKAQAAEGDLEAFLRSLELKVEVSSATGEDLARVAELIQRTNQFNLTTIRRNAREVERLWRSPDVQILVVRVQDRFGDYGLVGALVLRREPERLEVDTFVLSCRVLGRGVEQRVINTLGEMAVEEGRRWVSLGFRETQRNEPARQFLEKSFGEFQQPPAHANGQGPAEAVFNVPANYAAKLSGVHRPEQVEVQVTSATREQAAPAVSTRWHEEAYRLSRVADIGQEITRGQLRTSAAQTGYIAPRTASETAVAKICAEILGLECVSTDANFFRIGGDSLLAVRVIARIASELDAEMSIDEFFEGPTVTQIAARLAGAGPSDARITPADSIGPAPLSWAQQRLWFIHELEGGSTAYHIPLGIRLRGELDRASLQAALDALLARHAILRTVFAQIDGEPVSRVMAEARFELDEVLDGEVLQHSREQLLAPFDLTAGPLIRGRLLRVSQNEHVLLITMHHMISDGWSLGVLTRELSALYDAFHSGKADPLPPLPIQYADYARWQRQALVPLEMSRQLEFWKQHLQNAPELLELPTDRPRPATPSYRGENVQVVLDAALTRELKALGRRFGLTLSMMLYAAWTLVLARLSGQDDIVVGMPVANRPRSELEGLIGLFVNTIAVRVRLDDDPTVTQLLQRVKRTLVEAYAQQEAPFEQVVELLRPSRSLSHAPVFQVMFVMQPGSRNELQSTDLKIDEEPVPLCTSQFDLTLFLHESAGAVAGCINYASDLFDAQTIERWAGHFDLVLRGMAEGLQKNVSQLSLMNEGQRHQLVELFNATRADYPRGKRVHDLFESQVQRTPDSVALCFEGQSITYAELDCRANQLARYLREKGVGPDQLVGVFIERSLEMVVALLGVLKAGGAYVPLDPKYPTQRLAHMLEDASPKVILVHQSLRSRLPETAAAIVVVDTEWDEIARQSPTPLESSGADSRSLAYVIYTSGSTGKPKGVMVEQEGVVNFLASMQRSPAINATDCMLAVTTVSFDIAALEIYLPLITGARVVLASRQAASDADALISLIEQHGVTMLQATPSTWQMLLSSERWSGTRALKALSGGEALTTELSARLLPGVSALWNLYGPTETTIWSCAAHVTEGSSRKGSVESIGQPIANTQIYILDAKGQPVPIGVVGEIHIGGVGVARGYRNRPDLTEQRFTRDPFDPEPSARIYRTGDLGRWRPNGTIDYLGRCDHQVKLRGFRIELGEIEAQLAAHPQVNEAAVIAREDEPGEKRLVAYFTRAGASAPSTEDLRAHLAATLPDYMVPAAFVSLERLPLTSNGKVNRLALPAPEAGAYESREYETPQGEIEEILAGIWQGLLRVERVSRSSSFFQLGGHSLLIMQMLERLRRVGLSVEMRSVFESPRLCDLASVITNGVSESFEAPPNGIPAECDRITPQMLPLVELLPEHLEQIAKKVPGGAGNIQDIYPLAPLQEGILFHHLLDEQGGDTYAVTTALSVPSRERLEELIAALLSVIDRHDILRSAMLWEDLPRPVQVVYREATLSVEEIALERDGDVLRQLEERMKSESPRLDLRQAPLMRLLIAPDPRGPNWYVLLRSHHIVGDYTSQEIVLSEVVAHLNGKAGNLPAPVPYRNHVAQALAYSQKHDAESFFRGKLGDVDEPTAPFGIMDVREAGRDVREAHLEFEVDLARRVRTQASKLNVSVAALFHAAWGVVIAHTSGRDDVVFGSVFLGRLQGSVGTQRILGMFINTLPLRLKLHDVRARDLVEQTQRELVESLGHEQASLAIAQRCSGVAGSAPLFTALLNYRHGASNPLALWNGADGIRVLGVQERTNYPITLSVDDLEEGFALTAQTNQHIDPARIAGYLHQAVRSLVAALEDASEVRPVLALSILSQEERRQVVEVLNATAAPYPQEKLIHNLFEEQVLRSPDAIAVTHAGESLTYAELNSKANQLARYLRDKGVGPDGLVGICVERSLAMVVGLLGVLKAGGAYMPLDPNYPTERLQYMLEDAAPRLVLTQESLKAALPVTSSELIDLNSVLQGDVASLDRENLQADEIGLSPRNLLYVIYTSGSTGRPKGTAMPHRSMGNLIEWHRQTLPAESQRVLQFAALSFDVAFQETFSTLGTGGTLVLLDEWVRRDPRALMDLLGDERIERLFVPPMVLQGLAECAKAGSVVPTSLRDVITAGEQLRISAEIVALFGSMPGCRLHNHYGPTEAHVVTALTLEADPQQWPALPTIGRPIANTQIYVLSAQKEPVPEGLIGELYIGGANVARGYLNRPELTSERFLPDPFSDDSSAHLYKTGDQGRWRPDGTIEYLGRNDDQVKIRGFRIETGEIEAQLALHEQVREAAVIAREDVPGEKFLVAYVTARDGEIPRVDDLRAHLRAVLPEHMVPGAFVILESLPVTPSGKLDRRALPAPESDAYATQPYEAPMGGVEGVLAGIWKEVLGVEQVGRDDNFFDLGGHSLSAVQVVTRVQAQLGVEMPVSRMFAHPVLRQLSDEVRSMRDVDLLGENADIDELLQRVASMPEGRVERLLGEWTRGEQP